MLNQILLNIRIALVSQTFIIFNLFFSALEYIQNSVPDAIYRINVSVFLTSQTYILGWPR